MDIAINEDVSLLDQVKMQAQVLIPLLRAFRAELGTERADAIALRGLREWSRELYRRLAAQTPGSPRERWEALTAAPIPRIGGAVDMTMLKQEPDALEFNVTGCRFADFFRQLGEPELGFVLLCEGDEHIAEIGAPEVTLARTQTIMRGGAFCDFRYRMKSGAAEKEDR